MVHTVVPFAGSILHTAGALAQSPDAKTASLSATACCTRPFAALYPHRPSGWNRHVIFRAPRTHPSLAEVRAGSCPNIAQAFEPQGSFSFSFSFFSSWTSGGVAEGE